MKNLLVPAIVGVAEHDDCRHLQCLVHSTHHKHQCHCEVAEGKIAEAGGHLQPPNSTKGTRGRPLRNAARLCRALGGLPVKTPMQLSRRRRESSSMVSQDSSSSPCSSLSSSWVSLPPSPCPLCSHRVMIRRRSERTDTMIFSIFWGVAGESPAGYLFERAINSIYKIEVTF